MSNPEAKPGWWQGAKPWRMAIVLGIDKFMSECRALTNITGNGIACAFVSWWEGELDRHKLHEIIGGRDFTTSTEPVVEP